MKDKSISIRLNEEHFKIIEEAARKDGMLIAAYCRHALIRHTRETHPELFKEEKN